MSSAVTFTLPLSAADLTLMQYLIAQATPATSASNGPAVIVTTPPASTVSADGTTLAPGATGTLANAAGAWSFGASGAVLLNGVAISAAPPGPSVIRMEVANGGNLYLLPGVGSFTNGTTNWYEYVSGAWTAVQFPSGSPEATAA